MQRVEGITDEPHDPGRGQGTVAPTFRVVRLDQLDAGGLYGGFPDQIVRRQTAAHVTARDAQRNLFKQIAQQGIAGTRIRGQDCHGARAWGKQE